MPRPPPPVKQGWRYPDVPQQMIGVHLVVYFGPEGIMVPLLHTDYDINCKDGWGRAPP